MLVACWSVKGGSGTTTVAAALALLAARSSPGALLVDLGGEAAAVLGVDEADRPGLSDWLASGADVPANALHRLEIEIGAGRGVCLLPLGSGGPGRPPRAPADRVEQLAAFLASDPRTVVVDCGPPGPDAAPVAATLAAAAGRSLLVVRPCYLSVRRAVAAAIRPSAAVVVAEPWRSLTTDAVAEVLGVPVVRVPFARGVAAAVDRGLVHRRMPTALARPLRPLVVS